MKKLVKIFSVTLVVFMLINTLTFSIVLYDFINSPIWHICLIVNGLGAVIILTHLICHIDESDIF